MSRAALFPSVGDPFLVLHTLKYFWKYWQDEVDKLYLRVGSPVDPTVVEALQRATSHPKIEFSYTTSELAHGTNLQQLLSLCKEDHIILIEDDSIVFKKGIIDFYFQLLEKGSFDMIGSPRTSCHPEISSIVQKKFNLNFQGIGDQGPAYWPCFLWISAQNLRETDQEFTAHLFKAGDQLFGRTLAVDSVGDTLVWASLQLRDRGLRILDVPQYHCGPDDFSHKGTGYGIFSGACGYMHFGSLSSGIQSYLLDENNFPLKYRTLSNIKPAVPVYNPNDNADEMARRIAWWIQASKCTLDHPTFPKMYEEAIDRFANLYKVTQKRVDMWTDLYLNVIRRPND